MAEVIGLIASTINILEGVSKTKSFLEANVHAPSTLRAELVPLLGRLTAFEGILRGLQLECELDESNDGRLRVLAHIVEPLQASKVAVVTIAARLQRVISVGKVSIAFGKMLDKDTLAALHVLDQTKPVLDLALSADQRSVQKRRPYH